MAGTVIADNLQAASTSTLVIKNGVANTPPTIQDSAGTQIGTFCRAWVNFDGTGTVAIRASFNVTSITDNGTGDYTVNFTTAMPDVNYSAVVTNISNTSSDVRRFATISGAALTGATLMTTTQLNVITGNPATGTLSDLALVNVAIFR